MAEIKDPENTIIIELKNGPVTVELLPDIAPGHVARMKELTREGAYDNVVFHRVIDGFMAQTGDVEHGRVGRRDEARGHRRQRQAGPQGRVQRYPARSRHHRRGAQPVARFSANSQFFINFSDNHFLNRQYTVYGRVIDGMEHVDKIVRGEPPAEPDVMVSVKVAVRCVTRSSPSC